MPHMSAPVIEKLYLMKHKALFFLLILFCIQVKASSLFCENFTQFVEASNGSQSVSILLTSDWSSMSISCSHNQLASEKQFCSWLVENSSKENMKLNVASLENCLKGTADPISSFQYDDIVANYSVSEVPNMANDIEITVSYSYGNYISKPYLKLVVSRFND